MADLFTIREFREYLVGLSIVRRMEEAANGLPQCILDPREGMDAPTGNTYADAVVSLSKTNNVPARPLEEFLQKQVIAVIVRSRKSEDGELIQRRIQQSVEGKKLFVMGALTVEQVQQWSGDQPLGSDRQGYTRMQTLIFEVRVRSLAGTPYWP